MAKTRRTRQTRSLYFEQVPLSAVKTNVPATLPGSERTKAEVPAADGARTADAASHLHALQFYDSPDTLCRIVGRFIGEGIDQGAAAILIVTPDHQKRIEDCLRQGAKDVAALKQSGRLVTVDARDTLNQFMVDGVPNPSLFRRTVGALLTQASRREDSRRIRAYGEMVDLLWKDGEEAPAIRLETLWNQLARTVDFDLLCGYSMGHFYKGSMRDEITRQHTHVLADGGTAVPIRSTAVPA